MQNKFLMELNKNTNYNSIVYYKRSDEGGMPGQEGQVAWGPRPERRLESYEMILIFKCHNDDTWGSCFFHLPWAPNRLSTGLR